MWNNFEQSPTEDETISNAFSSRGVFKISSDDVLQNYPKVQASVQNGRMVIAIDKSIVLLENEMVAKCSFLNFNAQIDVISISNTGNLIVCGLSDGEIHGIFIKGIPLFNLCVKVEDAHITGSTFAGIEQIGNRFFLTCTNGSVYRLSEIDESPLKANLNISINDNETVTFDETIVDNVTIEQVLHAKRSFGELTAVALIPKTSLISNSTSELQVIGGTHSALYFREKIEDCKIKVPEIYEGVKHIYNLENIILVLTNSGHLLEVCPLTKLLFNTEINDELSTDEVIIMDCSDDNIELLVLTKKTEDNERWMRIIEYPTFKCTSELELSEHSWLVQQPKGSVNLYYLGGENVNDLNIPTNIEMRLVSETHPSDRFKKLIAKGHLEEAEDFGVQFELSLQPIYEAKAKRLILELCAASETQIDSDFLKERLDKLLILMKKIESQDFFKNNRMIPMPSRTILAEYLKEVLKHLDEENDEYHISEIIEQQHRLQTLTIIDPYEIKMDWQKFVYNSNLVKIITPLFKTDMLLACLIWKRHASSIMQQLKEQELRTLLNLIPGKTEPFCIIQWLRQFVPTIGSIHPNLMPFITDWSIQRIVSLQHAEHWPEIGLEFSTKVVDIFEELEFLHSDVLRQDERNIRKLREIVHALQDLSVLKTSYNLISTLDNYLQESIEDTALYILQRVHLSKLNSLVNDFLYPIFHEKGKSPVTPIRQYISLLVANRSSFATWLPRAVACIQLLHNEDDRLESALLVLQSSPVPWPDTVDPLVKLRASTHPLALKINTEHEIQVIKIMKVKYGWPAESPTDLKHLNLLASRVIKMDLPDMLDDILVLIKAAPEIAASTNFICCYELVRREKPEMAYKFYKILESDKNSKSAEDVGRKFLGMLENSVLRPNDDQNITEQKRLLEFYKFTASHDNSVQKRIHYIQNHLVLVDKFGLVIDSVNDLVPYDNRLKLLDKGIEKIIERSQATENITYFIVREICELSNALDIGKIFCVWRICKRIRCLQLSCSLTYAMLEIVDCTAENKSDFINLALELIAEQMIFAKSGKQLPTTLSRDCYKDNDPLAFPLAYELLVSSLEFKQLQPQDMVELLNFVRVAVNSYSNDATDKYYGTNEKEINEHIRKSLDAMEISVVDVTLNFSVANASFDVKPTLTKRQSISVFDNFEMQPQQTTQKQSNVDQQSVVKFVSRTLLLILLDSEDGNSLFNKLRLQLPDELKNDIDGAREDFFLSLEHLVKGKAHDVWYTMAQYLLHFQKHAKCKIINKDFVSLQLRRVFRNVLMQKDINFIDLFVMLIADNHSTTLLENLNNDMKTDQQKLNLLTLSELYCVHFEEKKRLRSIHANRMKHYYYMEFCKEDPSIRGKFNAEIDDIEQLLKEFHNKKLDVRLLERMSRDFELDYQQMLVTQVISILRAQELKYDIKTNAFGDEELVLFSTIEQIRILCQPYIDEIKNIELLTAKLQQFISEINIYFYELYLYVIEILSFIGDIPKEMQVWTSILHFLKHKMITRRLSKPGQVETDFWLKSQSDMGVLPKVARFRLPFMPIVENPLKDILDSEISVDNCESWFPLIQMHTTLKGSTEISKTCDYFCMSAVRNSISAYKIKNNADIWHLQPTNNAFLKSVLRLIQHVQSHSKAFLILYFVSNYAQEGADQVEAAYECYKYAIANESLITDPKSIKQLDKIKRKYPVLRTQHLLYVYGLTEENLMRLVENPTELILNLYNHEIILKSSKLDINTLAKEIAQLHELDIDELQFQLLKKWLSFSVDSVDGTVLEETFIEDQNLAENASTSNTAENVIRANYILNSWPKENAIQFLVAHIFPSDGTVNTAKQLQMYECFSKLNDGSASFSNVLNQSQYIAIKCVHELKQLGYNSSVQKFADCNKINILKTLWRYADNPHTLKILANICLGYDIYLSKIWNGILKRMCISNMVHELNALVDVLSCKPQLLHTDGLAMAWECVLKDPFKTANQTRSVDQEEKLNKILFRLQSCPVVHKMNLFEFAEQCIRLDRPHMAAIMIAFTNDYEQRRNIKQLISARKSDKLRKEILDLEDAGILSVIVDVTLKELDL